MFTVIGIALLILTFLALYGFIYYNEQDEYVVAGACLMLGAILMAGMVAYFIVGASP